MSRPRFYTMLDIDERDGTVDLAASLTGDLCAIRPGGTTVDLDTGTAA